jgi:hypothetical protein
MRQGGQFRIAFGVNDCDGEGRQTQLYYPEGWAHSNSATFAQAVLADGEGKAPAERPELEAALDTANARIFVVNPCETITFNDFMQKARHLDSPNGR